MSSKPSRQKTRKQLSKADLKAYESRRAAERHRIATPSPTPSVPTEPASLSIEHSFKMSRDQEYAVIKSDLNRLLIIMAILIVALIALTFVLR